MAAWTITRIDVAAGELRAGIALTGPGAWGQAAAGALDEFARQQGALEECVVTVGGSPALIVAGRTAAGKLDTPATRAAAEQLVLAVAGQQILDELLGRA